MIWFTSDLHFCHDREFLYKPRGFNTINEMNYTIVDNWNRVVKNEDDVYVLGDIMLGDNVESMRLLNCLNGQIHIIRGNHDTDTRIKLYKESPRVVEIADALYLKYNHYHFYCTHFPCMTGNLEKESLTRCTLNLYGHTHQTSNFYMDMPFMYHVGVDSHNCTPVSVNQIISDMRQKVKECKDYL